jgi:hypothetical protein
MSVHVSSPPKIFLQQIAAMQALRPMMSRAPDRRANQAPGFCPAACLFRLFRSGAGVTGLWAGRAGLQPACGRSSTSVPALRVQAASCGPPDPVPAARPPTSGRGRGFWKGEA